MKQLVILIVIALVGVGVYYYMFKPKEFEKIVKKNKPSLNASSQELYKYANSCFSSNSFEDCIKYSKKALAKDYSEDNKLDLSKAPLATYQCGASYDQLDKTDAKIEYRQQAVNWFRKFLDKYEDPKWTQRARRRLDEIEATGLVGKPNAAD